MLSAAAQEDCSAQMAAALSLLIGSVPLDVALSPPQLSIKNVEEVSSCSSKSQTHIALINK